MATTPAPELPDHIINFKLFNTEDNPVLYISNDPSSQTLTGEIINRAGYGLEIPTGAGEAGADNHHLAIRFRKGILADTGKVNATIASGWKSSPVREDADGPTVYLLNTGPSVTIASGKKIILSLAGLQIAGAAARATRVELLYRGLRSANTPADNLTGTSIELLDVVSHRGHRKNPLTYSWSAGNRIVNNGTAQTLHLVITNIEHKAIDFASGDEPLFVFSFDTPKPDGGWSVKAVKFQAPGKSLTTLDQEGTSGEWKLTAKKMGLDELPASATIAIDFTVSATQPGPCALRVRQQNLLDRWDDGVLLPIERSPLSFKEDRVGVGMNEPLHALDVQGDINTSGKVMEGGNALLPKGAIIMWSGAVAPAGWALCDGNQGTPDLRNRFIVALGSEYEEKRSGGSKELALQIDHLPAHTHAIDMDTTENGEHNHSHLYNYMDLHSSHGGIGEAISTIERKYDITRTDMSREGKHRHQVRGDTKSAGKGSPIDIRPPYYALAFIIKL